ncbi:unnamed protein product [Auanema sp. JU1783]|nr:unnamed protein product [Auanema sp. JU1783]
MDQRASQMKNMRVPWLHCNKCLREAVEIQKPMFITKCSHIICIQCAQRQNESADKKCVVCGKPSGLIELGKLPPNVAAMYFTEPYQFSSVRMENLKRMLTFQKKAMDHLEHSQLNRFKKEQEENRILREKVMEMRKRTSSLESVRRQKMKRKMLEEKRGSSCVPAGTSKKVSDDFFSFQKSTFNIATPHHSRNPSHQRRPPDEKQLSRAYTDHMLMREKKSSKSRTGVFF